MLPQPLTGSKTIGWYDSSVDAYVDWLVGDLIDLVLHDPRLATKDRLDALYHIKTGVDRVTAARINGVVLS